MSSISRGQRQQQAVKHKTSKDKDAIGSSSSVSPSKRARSDRVQSREQSPAKSTTSSPAKSTTSRSQGKKPAEVALVTSAAGTSEAPTLEVDMPIVEESSTTLNTKEPSAPAQRQATEKIKDKRKRTTSSYGKEYKNKKGEDSEFDEDEDDEDDENEDEDESAKKKLPPTQIAVTAKNKKGRQIKSVTPDGKKITLTYTDLPLNSTILFHTP
jgi:hypothetical protein